MTPQEIINAVYTGILAQGGPSLNKDEDEYSKCKYDNGEGKHCAVGLFLTPKVAQAGDLLTDGTSVESLMNSDLISQVPTWFKDNMGLLSQLQEAHDCFAHEKFTKEAWHSKISALATSNGLEEPALEEGASE